MIAEFKAYNPSIRVEVFVGNSRLNLARGESDIAVRATENPPENLFGRKIATIAAAGHAPQAEQPQVTAEKILEFLK